MVVKLKDMPAVYERLKDSVKISRLAEIMGITGVGLAKILCHRQYLTEKETKSFCAACETVIEELQEAQRVALASPRRS